MVLSVIENAYLRKAEEISSFNETHKKLLLFLLHEKKHYTKEELLCFANYCEPKLEKVLNDLERASLVKVNGWLVGLEEEQLMTKEIVGELKYTNETKIFNKKRQYSKFY